ncbi:hypothetical protein EBU95_14375 [bacterium]|nr:hypothetical protein [bacterium]
MQKTKKQKLEFTVTFQLERAIEELLSEAYHEEKYDGLLAISWNHDADSSKTNLSIQSKKIPAVPEKRQQNTVYFHICQGKGTKRL